MRDLKYAKAKWQTIQVISWFGLAVSLIFNSLASAEISVSAKRALNQYMDQSVSQFNQSDVNPNQIVTEIESLKQSMGKVEFKMSALNLALKADIKRLQKLSKKSVKFDQNPYAEKTWLTNVRAQITPDCCRCLVDREFAKQKLIEIEKQIHDRTLRSLNHM